MKGEFDLRFWNGVSFVWEWERERVREEERAARFFGGKNEETPTHIMRTKFSSYPNHVAGRGP